MTPGESTTPAAPSGPPPEEAAPVAGVRWTEHGPVEAPAVVPEVPVEAEVPAVDDRAARRERLADRGLVRREPAVRIRDVAGDAPPRPVVADPGPVDLAGITPDAAGPDDPADDADHLDDEPVGSTSSVACPSCRSSQQVSDGASGYRCLGCSKVWRWALCAHCEELSLTLARQESWRCTHCGDYSRSWWRTATGRRDAPTVVTRRQAETARRVRAEAYERAQRRRWKVLASGAVVIAAVSAWAVAVSRGDEAPTDRGPTGAVCTTFRELRSDFAAGAAGPAAVRIALDDLATAANDAIPPVRLAAQRWAASGRPGDETFEAAAVDLEAACAPTP